MDTACIDLQRAEAEEASGPVTQVSLALNRLLQQDLAPETRGEVSLNMETYVRRGRLIDALIESLSESRTRILRLLADGHPDLPVVEVDDEVLKDIDDNVKALLAARATFKTRNRTVSVIFGPEGEQHAPRNMARMGLRR